MTQPASAISMRGSVRLPDRDRNALLDDRAHRRVLIRVQCTFNYLLKSSHELENRDLRSFPDENMKALIISADNFEDSELLVPYYRLKEAGVEVTPMVVRKEPQALKVARNFFVGNKPVAAICHGPQILISASLLKGRHATC
jgi:hypothetical protein